jgi:pyrimidine-nucleoside phosphorylase
MQDVRRLINRRRDAQPNSAEDLEALAQGAASGTVPDYQLAAWLMAAYLNPLSLEETAALTLALARSGERLDLSPAPKPWVDKHSTGGVGDKTTLVALPVLAACGLTVAKMSGRGLGITGGTVDKLASVPGFRLDLSPEEMVALAARTGLALTGQTPRLAPADGALYALRDATGTVGSIPLIVASILSKKLAAGAETIVLDVKCGSGAFMTSLKEARELAAWLVEVGGRCGVRVRCAITDMSQPMGSAVGNALEVREAAAALHGGAPARFRALATGLCAEALAACGAAATVQDGLAMAERALSSGAALERARRWFEAQGASPAALDGGGLEVAPVLGCALSPGSGWVAQVDARRVGQAVVDLGGGRRRKEDAIDLSVGVEVLTEVGDRIEAAQPWARVYARDQGALERALHDLAPALDVADGPVAPIPWRLG